MEEGSLKRRGEAKCEQRKKHSLKRGVTLELGAASRASKMFVQTRTYVLIERFRALTTLRKRHGHNLWS